MDDILAKITQEASFIGDQAVQTPGNALGKPLRQEEIGSQKGHFLSRRLKDGQKTVGHFVLWAMQRAKVPSHGSRSDDIERETTGPDAHLDLSNPGFRTRALHGEPLHLRLQLVQEKTRLLPHETVQRADILDIERRRQGPTLLPMRLALGQNQAKADDPSEKVARTPRLLKVIGARAHDIQERLVVGDQEMRVVEDIAEVDEAFVGDGFHPFEGNTTTGVIEDDSEVCQAALVVY